MNNSKGRHFGRFNILDFVILIIIASIIGGGFYVYSQYKQNSTANMGTVEYAIEIKGVDEKFVAAISNGDFIRESVRGNDLGSVSGKSSAPTTNIYSDYINGKYVISEVPGKLDLVLTLTSAANITSRNVTVGGLEIRIGQKIYIKGKGYAGEGYILNVDIKE